MNYDDLNQAVLILTSRASAANGYVAPLDFVNIFPRAIEYAEDRINREIVFVADRGQVVLAFDGTTRELDLSVGSPVIIVVEGLSAVVGSNLVPFYAASLDDVDLFWPNQALTVDLATFVGDLYWAMKDANTIVVCPIPDAALQAVITGIFRPAYISATNTTTYISDNYPDLMLAACMIFMSGYVRNFGAQADTPKMAISWEDQYKTLRDSATLEEQRRRGQGAGWSANLPTPIAQPQRT